VILLTVLVTLDDVNVFTVLVILDDVILLTVLAILDDENSTYFIYSTIILFSYARNTMALISSTIMPS
jgi:hypothetical protein